MSDKFYVGLDITGFENTGLYKPISRVTLKIDDENVLTAGDDTGLELTASCPHATQQMVDSILAQVKGYQYQAYTADAANVDPAAELGDGVTVGGIYSVLSKVQDDGEGYPGISAPGEVELEEEFPSAGPMTQEINRQIAQTRSSITKTAEEIRLEVENELNGLSSSFTVQLDSIKSEVQGLNGQVSIIEQYVESITLEVSNESTSSTITLKAGNATISSQYIKMDGLVTFTGLYDGTTKINGACLATGTVIADVEVKGSKFSNTSGSAYLEVGGTDYGDMTLYGQGENRVFQVYDQVGGVSLSGYDVEFLRVSGAVNTTYPQGNWNFSGAIVSGVTATFA